MCELTDDEADEIVEAVIDQMEFSRSAIDLLAENEFGTLQFGAGLEEGTREYLTEAFEVAGYETDDFLEFKEE